MLARRLPRENFSRQDFVRARDLRAAHDETDAVLFAQRDGDLQRGVAGADDEEILILVLGGIDEAVENLRQIFAGDIRACADYPASPSPGTTLPASYSSPSAVVMTKSSAFALHRFHFGVEHDVQLFLAGVLLPGVEDRFARAGLERQIAAAGIMTGSDMTNLRAW